MGVIRDLPGFRTNNLSANDDGFTGLVNLGFSANFFGTTFTGLYCNNNGNVTFGSGISTFTPTGIATGVTQPMIAPFWADVDTRGAGSALMTYGIDTVDGHTAFGVNWFGVGYYNSQADKLNWFQLIIIRREDSQVGDFDIEMNYGDGVHFPVIAWETGSASGGTNGFGGSSAHMGYTNGLSGSSRISYELPGSGVNGAFLDANMATGLKNNSLPASNPLGRYTFPVRGGVVIPPGSCYLQAQGLCSGSIGLEWSSATNAAGYNLYRTTHGGSDRTRLNGNTPIPGLGYTDSGRTDNVLYDYEVHGVTAAGIEGPSSNVVSITTYAGAPVPTGIVVTPKGAGTLEVTWNY